MFETLGGFSIVYWSLAVIVVLLILFEEPLIALEDKVKARVKQRIKTTKNF